MSEILINIKIVKISEHAQMSKIAKIISNTYNFRTLRKSLIFYESLKKFARAKVASDYKGDF